MRSETLRIAIVYRTESSFVSSDISMLARHFEVVPVRWTHSTGPLALARAASEADIVFSWFAGPYAALATYYGDLFDTKSVTVLGGFECARIDEIGYGAFSNPLLALFVTIAVRRSDAVLAVDRSLVEDLSHLMRLERGISVVPTGYDSTVFRPDGPKENLVLTVAEVDRSSALRKGLPTFARVARRNPDMKFVLAGHIASPELAAELQALAGGRLQLCGRLELGALVRLYQRAKVYCQLSRHEGLPNALCEAMLSECVPVGTRHGGIPSAIGETGFYCEFGDIESTEAAVHQACRADGVAARQRISSLFPLRERERKLVQILTELQ